MLIYFCVRKNCIWEDSSKDLKPPLTIWSHLPLHGSTVCSIDQKLHHRNKKRLAKITPHGKSTSQAKEIKPIMWARIQEISARLLPLLCDREIHFLALCLCWHLWNEHTSSLPTFDCLIYLREQILQPGSFLTMHPSSAKNKAIAVFAALLSQQTCSALQTHEQGNATLAEFNWIIRNTLA